MMHDDAFLQAIIESPDDDTPRLVYAGWLDEHGQPERAEFIRVQCELARMPAGDPRRVELEARERELLKEHEGKWAGPLRERATRWTFRRGFVERVTVPARLYLEHASTLFRQAPVCSVELDLTQFEVAPAVLGCLPEALARDALILPVGHREGRLVLATPDAGEATTRLRVKSVLGRAVELVAAPGDQVLRAIYRHYLPADMAGVLALLLERADRPRV